MPIQDSQIDFLRKRKRWGPMELNAITSAAHTSAETFDAGLIMADLVNESVTHIELNSLGLVALDWGANNNDGDEIQCWVYLPFDVDPQYDLGFRLNYSQSQTDADGKDITWTMQVGIDKVGVAYQSIASLVNLDTPIGVDTYAGAAYINTWTPRGILTAATMGLTRDQVEDGPILRMEIKNTTVPAEFEDVRLLGVEMDYVAARCDGTGNAIDRPLRHDL